MPPIATPAISSKPRGELARHEGAQKPIGKDSPVIQPNLEVVGRSLDCDRGFETGLTHFLDGVGTDIVYQTQRMWPLRPDEDVGATRVLSPQPSDALADLIDTLVAVQNHSVVPAQDSDFKAPAPENLEGERKIVTALFADIKGSMEVIEDLNPEEARAIVDPALK